MCDTCEDCGKYTPAHVSNDYCSVYDRSILKLCDLCYKDWGLDTVCSVCGLCMDDSYIVRDGIDFCPFCIPERSVVIEGEDFDIDTLIEDCDDIRELPEVQFQAIDDVLTAAIKAKKVRDTSKAQHTAAVKAEKKRVRSDSLVIAKAKVQRIIPDLDTDELDKCFAKADSKVIAKFVWNGIETPIDFVQFCFSKK